MPEPSDPLSARLAAAPGLATLLDEARATWLGRADREATPDTGPDTNPEVNADIDTDADPDSAVDESTIAPVELPAAGGDSAAASEPSVRVRPSTPRWRAFEDAFPTFYQFTNRPR
jgi:hypothetical protein